MIRTSAIVLCALLSGAAFSFQAAVPPAPKSPPPPSAPTAPPSVPPAPKSPAAPTLSAGQQAVAARQANLAMLKQYQWDCRAEVYTDGSLKDTRIEQVQYGPNGQVQRTQLSDQTSHLPIGPFRRAIAKGQLEQVEKYLTGLRGLLSKYTDPGVAQVDAFLNKAMVSNDTSPEGLALLKFTGSSVIEPGDSVSIWVDAAKHQWHRVEITTTYEGAAATITATYKTNPAGLAYLSMAHIDVPSKKASLLEHCYDYQPLD